MNLNQKFAIFCAKKCLHLWDAPEVVVGWLNDPQLETAPAAIDATWVAAVDAAWVAANATAWAAVDAAWAAANAAWAAAHTAANATAGSERAALAAAKSCRISVNSLKQEFLSTWSNEDLSTTDPDWIKHATVEVINRECLR